MKTKQIITAVALAATTWELLQPLHRSLMLVMIA